MEHIKLESKVDTSEFWNDPYVISQYVNSIITSCGKEDIVSIKICDYNQTPFVAFYKKSIMGKNIGQYTISLPKIKDFYSDTSLKEKDIKLRKAFLKHEVAHIIFSEMDDYANHKSSSSSSEHLLRNALEDVRIEYRFGQKFQGANNTFFEVQESFYLQAKSKIENSKPNLFMLALYFMYKSKKFEFNVTQQVKLYDQFFQKYKNFLNLSQKELIDLVEKIKFEFDSILNSDELKDENNSDANSGDDENSENNSDANSGDDENSENDSDANSGDDENSENDSDANSDDDDDEDSENDSGDANSDDDSDGDTSDNSESDDNESSNNQIKESDDSESADTYEDFSNSIAKEIENNAKEEQKATNEKFNKNNDDKNSSDGQSIDENNNIDIFKLQKLSKAEKIELFNVENVDDFVKYNNSSMKKYGSEIIDISKYLSLSSKKINFSIQKDNKKNYINYEGLTSKNRKNINNLVNYFKLKFQQKERTYNVHNKEDGLLHNESLFKMFNDNFDKKIFYTIESAIVSKTDVSFLLDFSGSMMGRKVKNLVQTLIVMNEIFTRLEIPFNVFTFGGGRHSHYWRVKNKNEISVLRNAFAKSKIFKFNEKENNIDSISFSQQHDMDQKETVFCWIARNTSSAERKNILKLMLKLVSEKTSSLDISKNFYCNLFGGGTPEVQAVIGLYNLLPKQKLFLINDGSYDGINLISKEVTQILDFAKKDKTYLQCSRLMLNLLEGETIKLYSQDSAMLFKNDIMGAFCYLLDGWWNDYRKTLENSENDLYEISIFRSFISNFHYANFSNNIEIEHGGYKMQMKYHANGDFYEVKFSYNKKINIKVNMNQIIKSYTDYATGDKKNITLLLNKDSIDNIADLVRWKLYECDFISKFQYKISTKNDNEYCYRSLFQKMRNEGWGVWGIGIECNNGMSYIGKEYFSSIRDSSDLQQNLEKRIKGIV